MCMFVMIFMCVLVSTYRVPPNTWYPLTALQQKNNITDLKYNQTSNKVFQPTMTIQFFPRKQKRGILLEVQWHQGYQGDLEHPDCRLIQGNPEKGERQGDNLLFL